MVLTLGQFSLDEKKLQPGGRTKSPKKKKRFLWVELSLGYDWKGVYLNTRAIFHGENTD
jgi:hypothetical protein